jgi:hypothetical protein
MEDKIRTLIERSGGRGLEGAYSLRNAQGRTVLSGGRRPEVEGRPCGLAAGPLFLMSTVRVTGL